MKRRTQFAWLCALAFATGTFAIVLARTEPTVGGQLLSYAEFHLPLRELQSSESEALFQWLRADFALIAAYTLLWTWGLRWLAYAAPSAQLAVWGRSLSWIAVFAALFDVLENVILWTAADVAAPHVSPWLPVLAKLKWSSTVLALAYGLLWWWGRRRSRVRAGTLGHTA